VVVYLVLTSRYHKRQLRIMTEKLYETLNNKLNNLRHSHIRKQDINPNIMGVQQTKLQTKLSSQNPEFDGCLSFPKRNRNTGTWYPKQLRKIYKIMFRDVVFDTKTTINCLYVNIRIHSDIWRIRKSNNY
jgi:hypothetical protein